MRRFAAGPLPGWRSAERLYPQDRDALASRIDQADERVPMLSDVQAKLEELEALKSRVEMLENEIAQARSGPGWRATGYYSAYYATAGFMLGSLGAIASLPDRRMRHRIDAVALSIRLL